MGTFFMRKQLPIILFLFLFALKLHAQKDALGSWNIINLKYTHNNKWSGFGEAQLRSLRFYNNYHYYEWKLGITYRLSDQFAFTLGGGDYNTYAEGGNFKTPMNNDETRLWQQLVMRQQLKKLRFEHRYRAEQRFTSNGYRNRFRYRLNISLPLWEGTKNAPTISAYNELFFTDRAPYFERNRVFVGINKSITENMSIQTGYLSQFDYRINDETGRNFFLIGLQFDLERTKGSKKSSGAVD
jgi:hypothetical protein